jgi:FAD/FMN-containing dehydrogenase
MAERLYQSWGRVPVSTPLQIHRPSWADNVSQAFDGTEAVLAIGLQRSYGDSALNNGGALVDMTVLDRVHMFEPSTGILRADAGVMLGDLYKVVIPHGWFLPVVPGTQFVTLGGAVANDIHGKNHHRHGSFGCHVRAIGLIRSDGKGVITRLDSGELFHATIGGLGLTGIIGWVEVQCLPIPSAFIDVTNMPVVSVQAAAQVLARHDASHEFTVAWIDTVHRQGRGVVHSGNWSENANRKYEAVQGGGLPIPTDAPNGLVGRWSVSVFNTLWYARHKLGATNTVAHLRSYFHPLDMLQHWNRLYGKRGMIQYQCVIPTTAGVGPIEELLALARKARQASFLTVLKSFGPRSSGGVLSFPMPGLTLALDFANTGSDVMALLDRCDDVVLAASGRVYIAKDCRLPGSTFRAMYPHWEQFRVHIDPKMSSSWWRRVVET